MKNKKTDVLDNVRVSKNTARLKPKKSVKKEDSKKLKPIKESKKKDLKVKKETKKANKKAPASQVEKKKVDVKPVVIVPKKEEKKTLKVRFLGGVGEIGKNMTVLEYGKDIIIIDAGLTFPSDNMPGVDLVIPDVTYLINNKERIKGFVITHGHEDHIGSLPYILKEINAPIYGTKLTLTLIESKLKEAKLDDVILNCIKPSSVIKLGCFSVEFINVNHSIAGAVGLAITTPVGVVFHSGDFKIDFTPVNGETMNLARIAEIGKKGVLLLMADSTNIEIDGTTMSEKVVKDTLDHVFADNIKRRLIIATFASNVHRLQQILDLAVKYNRKVAFSGRSMINIAEAAAKIGELNIPENLIIDVERIKNFKDEEVVIVSTGTQGEPMSALTRMACGEFNKVVIGRNDTVVISASVIPGNEKMIYGVINNLYRLGAEVIYESLEPIHVSGHACKGELRTLHSLIKPKFFIPVHGEYRHLKKHAVLAENLGMKESNILIAEIGDTVELTSRTAKFSDRIPSGSRYVDGTGIDGSDSFVLRDRIKMSEQGLVSVAVAIDELSFRALSVEIVARGVPLADFMVNEMKSAVLNSLKNFDLRKAENQEEVHAVIRKSIRNYLFKATGKNPMIMPIILMV